MLLTVRVETENHVKRRQYQMYDLLLFWVDEACWGCYSDVRRRSFCSRWLLFVTLHYPPTSRLQLAKKRTKVEQFCTLDVVL